MDAAHETALTAAIVAVAKSMGADPDIVRRLRDAVREPERMRLRRMEQEEVWLTTKQVCDRLGLCKKYVLDNAASLGVVKHGARLFRYPLSKVLAWESNGGIQQ